MSGSGTILDAIVRAGVPVDLVVADRPCRGLEIGDEAGIASVLVDRTDYGGFSKSFDREAYSVALADVLQQHGIDLVAMAGFGTILTSDLHDRFPGRVLNTHPSLLPAFKGWHAVADALASGVTETGCTVHVATEALDDGPILAQVSFPFLDTDDETTLHERIKLVERALYPEVLTRVMANLSDGHEPASISLSS